MGPRKMSSKQRCPPNRVSVTGGLTVQNIKLGNVAILVAKKVKIDTS